MLRIRILFHLCVRVLVILKSNFPRRSKNLLLALQRELQNDAHINKKKFSTLNIVSREILFHFIINNVTECTVKKNGVLNE